MTIKEIIIHHTASSRNKTTVRNIDDWHKLRWPGFISSLGWHIGYHYVITVDGKLTQTRRDNEIGAHCIPNDGRIGIALTGNFQTEKPTKQQLDTLGELLKKLKKLYLLNDIKIFGHNEKSSTECPGKNLMEWITLYRQLTTLQKLIEKLKQLLEKIRLT